MLRTMNLSTPSLFGGADTTPSLFDSMWDDINRLFAAPAMVGSTVAPFWQIRENDEAYQLRAALPGVMPKQVELTVEGGILSLRVNQQTDGEESASRVMLSRSVRLPDRVTADGIDAQLEYGVLTVVVPKAADAKPRRIEIGVGSTGAKRIESKS